MHSKLKSPKFFIPAIILVVAVAVTIVLWRTDGQGEPAKVSINNGKVATATPDVPDSTDKKQSATVTPGTVGGPTNSKDYGSNIPGQASSEVKPAKPTGQFISNPGGPGNPNPGNEESTCTTTPGAYCQIRFSSGGVTKSLRAKKTNADGSVLWTWSVKDIGLSSGTWQVTAVATNGDKTATSSGPQLIIK